MFSEGRALSDAADIRICFPVQFIAGPSAGDTKPCTFTETCFRSLADNTKISH